jgi:hypothetical protein
MTPVDTSAMDSLHFALRPWTEDEADLMIHQVDSSLQAIRDEFPYYTVYGQADWDHLHGALAFAEEEALLRFPSSPRAESWRWDHCYNLALSSGFAEGPEASEFGCYQSLFVPALDQGLIAPDDLAAWFSLHERRIGITVTELEAPPRREAAWLVQLGGDGFTAQANALLVQGSEGFELQGLVSYLFYLREADSHVTVVDLTGDSFPELVVSYGAAYCCGVFADHYIFSFEHTPAQRLRIAAADGERSSLLHLDSGELIPLQEGDEGPGFVFVTTPHDPYRGPCNFARRETYLWNGIAFELAETEYETVASFEYQDAEFCDEVFSLIRDPGEVLVAAQVFAYQRPPLDELRYRLAEDRARRGEVAPALEGFSAILANADDALDPSFLEAAEAFVAGYRTVSDHYRICARVAVCDPQAALRSAAERIPAMAYPRALDVLRDEGVPILAEGLFDFDSDGSYDLWAVVRHPGHSNLEFWVVMNGPTGPQALYVADTSTVNPRLEYASIRGLGLVVMLDRSHAFGVIWTSETAHILADDFRSYDLEPTRCYDLILETTREAARQLLGGNDPSTVASWLMNLPDRDCADFGDAMGFDSYYYTLGLAHELAGSEQAAVEAYLELWRSLPSSPYAVMARSKLVTVP